MKTILEVLKEARSYIATPEAWCKWSFARTKDGGITDPTSPAACSFCAVGAIRRAAGCDAQVTNQAVEYVERHLPVQHSTLPEFNDQEATHSDILVAFDRAISRFHWPVRLGGFAP